MAEQETETTVQPNTDTAVTDATETQEAPKAEVKDDGTLLGGKEEKEVAKEDTKEDAKETKEETGAPEKYEDFVVPEGFTAPIEEFSAFAKEMNLPQAQAQKVVDFFTNTYAPKLVEMQAQKVAEWRGESEKQFNKEALEVANRGMAAFSSPELKTLLNETGLGNHPQMVKLFNMIGTKLSESNLVDGQMTSNTRSDRPADKLFSTID